MEGEDFLKGGLKTYNLIRDEKVRGKFNHTELKDFLDNNPVSVLISNGVVYRTDKRGLIPAS